MALSVHGADPAPATALHCAGQTAEHHWQRSSAVRLLQWQCAYVVVLRAGTGYTVMHCHLQPHTDEGCMMKIHLVQQTCALLLPLLECRIC